VYNLNANGLDPDNVIFDGEFPGIHQFAYEYGPEEERYFYHSDHLGSSTFITDAAGNPYQFLQYLPFGEPFVSQHINIDGWATLYTFSAKEQDAETGYHYFGARYYDSELSVWLSVDPLADKYPSMSSYMYTAGNPVMRIDTDGRDHWKIGEDGKATLQDTKGKHIHVNGEKLSKYDFTGNEEAASTIATYYYDKNFSRNKYHLAKEKISIASFKKGKFDASSSYNIDKDYSQSRPSYARTMPGKGNSDNKNRIYITLRDGHMNAEFDNKYNLINCLSHERVHLIQGSPKSSAINELEAYYVMMKHSSWSKTDGRFRSDMKLNVRNYIGMLKHWGSPDSTIRVENRKYYRSQYNFYKKLFSPLLETSDL